MNIFFSKIFRYRDRKSPDRLGLYPERFHTEAMPERRYLWTSRIMVISGVFSICLTIMLALAIYVLLPQKEAGPVLYQLNDIFSELEKSQPSEVRGDPVALLTEELISRYIRLRHEIPRSHAELIYRWDKSSEFFQLSSIGVYQQFIYKMDYDQIVRFIEQDMVRKVEIDWVRQLTPELWQAQFYTTTTTSEYPQPQTIIWRAYLRIAYIDIKNDPEEEEGVHSFDYTHNPYGFRVQRYALGYAGVPQGADSYLEVAKKVTQVRAEEE